MDSITNGIDQPIRVVLPWKLEPFSVDLCPVLIEGIPITPQVTRGDFENVAMVQARGTANDKTNLV